MPTAITHEPWKNNDHAPILFLSVCCSKERCHKSEFIKWCGSITGMSAMGFEASPLTRSPPLHRATRDHQSSSQSRHLHRKTDPLLGLADENHSAPPPRDHIPTVLIATTVIYTATQPSLKTLSLIRVKSLRGCRCISRRSVAGMAGVGLVTCYNRGKPDVFVVQQGERRVEP